MGQGRFYIQAISGDWLNMSGRDISIRGTDIVANISGKRHTSKEIIFYGESFPHRLPMISDRIVTAICAKPFGKINRDFILRMAAKTSTQFNEKTSTTAPSINRSRNEGSICKNPSNEANGAHPRDKTS